MFKTYAVILPLILLVHTSCNLWCSHVETPVPGPAHACHDMPMKEGGSGPAPVHHDERCDNCQLQGVASKTFAPDLLKVAFVAVPVVRPMVTLQTQVHVVNPGFLPAEFLGSPPSHQVLLI